MSNVEITQDIFNAIIAKERFEDVFSFILSCRATYDWGNSLPKKSSSYRLVYLANGDKCIHNSICLNLREKINYGRNHVAIAAKVCGQSIVKNSIIYTVDRDLEGDLRFQDFDTQGGKISTPKRYSPCYNGGFYIYFDGKVHNLDRRIEALLRGSIEKIAPNDFEKISSYEYRENASYAFLLLTIFAYFITF